MTVPSTALSSATTSDSAERELQRRDGLGARDRVPEACAPLARRLPEERGDRQPDHHRQERRHEAEGQGRSPVPRSPGAPGAARRRAALTLASDATDLPLDPRHDARVRIEEALLHLRPAAEPSWSIVNWPGRTGNFFLVRLEHALHDGAIAVVREDLLGRRRLEEAQELRSPVRLVRARLDRRSGSRSGSSGSGSRTGGRSRVLRDQRLVLVGEEDVALAAVERVERVAGALVLHRRSGTA